MINLTIRTQAETKQVVAQPTDTFQDVVTSNGMDISKNLYYLNGSIVSKFEYENTLAQLGVEDDSTAILAMAVKADSNN